MSFSSQKKTTEGIGHSLQLLEFTQCARLKSLFYLVCSTGSVFWSIANPKYLLLILDTLDWSSSKADSQDLHKVQDGTCHCCTSTLSILPVRSWFFFQLALRYIKSPSSGHALTFCLLASTDQRFSDLRRSTTSTVLERFSWRSLEDIHHCKPFYLYFNWVLCLTCYNFFSGMLNLTAAFMHSEPHQVKKVHVFSEVSVCHIDESALFEGSVRITAFHCPNFVTR